MRRVRWTDHALDNLRDRDIDRNEADLAIQLPEMVTIAERGREIRMRRYVDRHLGQEMLLRVVVRDLATETIVVTVYKTSRIEHYLRG